MTRSIRIRDLVFEVATTSRTHAREIRRALLTLDAPTLQRFHDGSETACGPRTPLKLAVTDVLGMGRSVLHKRKLLRWLMTWAKPDAFADIGGRYDRESNAVVVQGEHVSDVVHHELCHAALHYDPERVLEPAADRDQHPVLHALATQLHAHWCAQCEAAGFSPDDAKRYAEAVDAFGDDAEHNEDWLRTTFEADEALQRVAKQHEQRFASDYCLTAFPITDTTPACEEFFVECWSIYLCRGNPNDETRERLKRRDPVMHAVMRRFCELREQQLDADGITAELDAILRGP